MSHILLIHGDARRVPLANGSVQCCVTSPPYYGLRDYGATGQLGLERLHDCNGAFTGKSCGECYICHMRTVFAEVWRVLRSDGTLWINIGDSYAGSWGNYHPHSPPGKHGQRLKESVRWDRPGYGNQDFLPPTATLKGLPAKNLCGIPQRLALALQADGWTWRSAITWCKTAPMPESVRDRPTRATEQILLLSKSPAYFYDQEAVRVDGGTGWHGSSFTSSYDVATKAGLGQGLRTEHPGHNLWDYWLLGPEPSSQHHFATFPTALAERCIRAGTPQAGCCPQCWAPYVRQVEHGESSWVSRKAAGHDPRGYHVGDAIAHFAGNPCVAHLAPADATTGGLGWVAPRWTTGFAPGCTCIAHALADGCRDPQHMDWLTTSAPSIVFDPFSGAGTTVLTARALGRHGIGMDLSWPYLQLSRDRLGLTALDIWLSGEKTPTVAYNDLPLFAKEPTP